MAADQALKVSRINASTSTAPGEVAGPQRVTANAAAAFARRAASAADKPCANPATNTPAWASPAPLLSTAETLNPDTC
jgi:hypothetical protein